MIIYLFSCHYFASAHPCTLVMSRIPGSQAWSQLSDSSSAVFPWKESSKGRAPFYQKRRQLASSRNLPICWKRIVKENRIKKSLWPECCNSVFCICCSVCLGVFFSWFGCSIRLCRVGLLPAALICRWVCLIWTSITEWKKLNQTKPNFESSAEEHSMKTL